MCGLMTVKIHIASSSSCVLVVVAGEEGRKEGKGRDSGGKRFGMEGGGVRHDWKRGVVWKKGVGEGE